MRAPLSSNVTNLRDHLEARRRAQAQERRSLRSGFDETTSGHAGDGSRQVHSAESVLSIIFEWGVFGVAWGGMWGGAFAVAIILLRTGVPIDLGRFIATVGLCAMVSAIAVALVSMGVGAVYCWIRTRIDPRLHGAAF